MSVTELSQLNRLKVLVPTNRAVYRLVSYGMVADFEDRIAEASDADVIPVALPSRRATVDALLARRRPPSRVSAPRAHYDVCVFVAMGPDWLPSLRLVRNLRSIASRIVVYLFDCWLSDLDVVSKHAATWSLVDDVFVSFSHAVDGYARVLDCNVHYLPQAIDPRWFRGDRDRRPIDVLSIGRRRESVHQELLRLAQEQDLFYYFQTARAPQAIDLRDNQFLLGRLCQNARLHVSWSVDATNPQRRGESTAITARWFESAASGAVVVGSPPRTAEFARLFPYPEFVRELDPATPADTEAVVMDALARNDRSERQALADHVRNAHSWSRRWAQIIETCGI